VPFAFARVVFLPPVRPFAALRAPAPARFADEIRFARLLFAVFLAITFVSSSKRSRLTKYP
jgi:hypothetical protein